MIALPRPNTPAFAVLALIVAEPGALTAEILADRLHPEPRHVGPFDAASWAAHVAALRAHRAEAAVAARTKAVATILHRLQQLGLIERCGGVRVAPWFEAMCERRGETKALRLARPETDRRHARELAAHRELLAKVRSCPGSVRELLAEGGGWRREAYADLGDWGVLVTPTRRTASEAGRALVGGGG